MKNREIYDYVEDLIERVEYQMDKLNPNPKQLKTLVLYGNSFQSWCFNALTQYQKVLNTAKYKNDIWVDANKLESKLNHLKIRANFGDIKFNKNGSIISEPKTIDKWLRTQTLLEEFYYECKKFISQYRPRALESLKRELKANE